MSEKAVLKAVQKAEKALQKQEDAEGKLIEKSEALSDRTRRQKFVSDLIVNERPHMLKGEHKMHKVGVTDPKGRLVITGFPPDVPIHAHWLYSIDDPAIKGSQQENEES